MGGTGSDGLELEDDMVKKHGGNVYAFSKKTGFLVDDIIDFSANINPLGMSTLIKASLDDILKGAIHYPDPNYKALLTAVSKHENVSEDQIVLGNGAIECIFLLAEHLDKKHVHIQAPTFIEYERAFKKYNKEVSYDYLNKKDFYNSAEMILRNTPETVDVMVICNPNNPTGALIEKSEMIKLLSETKKRQITLIVDEAFIDFSDDETAYSMVDQINKADHLIILKSLTKFYGIPGLRLGYFMTSSSDLVNSVKENRIPWAINSIVERAGILSLSDKAYIRQTKEYMISERKWLIERFAKLDRIKVYPSQGNYVFFKSERMTLNLDLEPFGIMIRNCENYEGLSSGYYRVAVKKREENVKLLEALEKIMN